MAVIFSQTFAVLACPEPHSREPDIIVGECRDPQPTAEPTVHSNQTSFTKLGTQYSILQPPE